MSLSTLPQAPMPSHTIDIPISPKPKYFLVRPGTNNIVPLIAVDELPEFFNLHSVPRSMKLEDTVGMVSLGNVEEGGYYDVVVDAGVEAASLGAPKKGGDSRSARSGSESGSGNRVHLSTKAAQSPKSPADPKAHGAAATSGAMSAPAPLTSPIGSEATLETKDPVPDSMPPQICRHWCATGFCRWGDACRYLHEMPLTLSGLQEVGLSNWPPWFRASAPQLFGSFPPPPPASLGDPNAESGDPHSSCCRAEPVYCRGRSVKNGAVAAPVGQSIGFSGSGPLCDLGRQGNKTADPAAVSSRDSRENVSTVTTSRPLSRRELTVQTIRRLQEPARAGESSGPGSTEGKGSGSGTGGHPRSAPRDVRVVMAWEMIGGRKEKGSGSGCAKQKERGKEKEIVTTGRLVDV